MQKIGFLGASVILILLIFSWPIYFFVLSGLTIIGVGIIDLGAFAIIEAVLIGILVVSWKVYEKTHK